MLARRSAGPFLRGAGALLGIVLALAVFFAPALLGAGQFLFRDTGRMHHPVKAFLAEELRHGRFTEWNPYMGLGVPVVATAVGGLPEVVSDGVNGLLIPPQDPEALARPVICPGFQVSGCGFQNWRQNFQGTQHIGPGLFTAFEGQRAPFKIR